MVMVLMDLSGDQTMSPSSPPPTQINLTEQIARSDTGSSPSPSSFQTQTSTETDEHDDEHSKASNQTVVIMQQASQQQTEATQSQQRRAELSPGSTSASGIGELKQPIVSGGSSFGDEDEEGRLMMSVDSEEEASSRVLGASLRLNQAELEARLKQNRYDHQLGSKQPEVESLLVAQMRDIVEGNQRNVASVLAKTADDDQEEDKENAKTTLASTKIEARCQQPTSSNDSLSVNQKNYNGQSRVSIDSAGQKRTRHVSRHQCRHHHHHHNPHHHHHHHHRHRQSISGGSLPGQMEAGASLETASSKPSSHTHHAHPHHHRHNNSHHHHLGRQRHSNAGHRHHHHHHHHHATGHHHQHHHHHQHKNQQESEQSKRNSPVQRLSLALIEAGENSGDKTKIEFTGSCANDSSMSSVSSSVNRQQRAGQITLTTATTNNPSQRKSSGSAVSGEHSTSAAVATNDSDQIATSKDAATVIATGHPRSHHHHHHHHHGSSSHHHHHHHHHQHCQHRSNKRRLVADARDSGEKQNDEGQEAIEAPVTDTRREPLRDLANDQTIENKSDQSSQHHNQHQHHHRNHCHCTHRHAIQAENQTVGEGDLSSSQGKAHVHHHHHNYCSHRHHRHHHHHQPDRQQQLRSRQKSISHTNVITNNDNEIPEVENPIDRISAERRDSCRPDGNEVVKMETSPPPQSIDLKSRQIQPAIDQQANLETAGESAVKLADSSESGHDEVKRDGTIDDETKVVNPKNQESLRSGSDETNDRQQEHQNDESNKLTRQMSSQSSRWSQNASGALPPTGSQDRRQSEGLLDAVRALQQTETLAINRQEGESTRQAVDEANGLLADRRCRLCWCCCCPCSALSTRDASTRSADKPKPAGVQPTPNSPVSANYPSLPNVPLEEIRSWGESFDKLMRSSDGRKVFQDFLRCEYSEENILFWTACEELKKEKDSKSIAAKARDIYEDYISILSSKEVSLDSRVRDVINNNIKRPTSNIFDEAQLQIYTLMHRDSYPRFINSIMYKKLAQIPISNSRKSSS